MKIHFYTHDENRNDLVIFCILFYFKNFDHENSSKLGTTENDFLGKTS